MRTFGYIGSGILAGSCLLIATSAIAGGFAIREQSTTGLGKAFADSAAGSDLSSMYWNPAAVTSQDGMNSLSSFSGILPDTEINPVAGLGANYDDLGLVGASYYNYQINQQLYIGLSINAPFGLVTEPNERAWAGGPHNARSEIFSINGAPTIGYKITPELSVAAGLQIQYMYARLSAVSGATTDTFFKGDDIAVGFTAGLLYKNESSGTSIGVGYRSTVDHGLEGDLVNQTASVTFPITAQMDTPEIVTASIRQDITPSFAVMGNVEWTNWSRLKELRVKNTVGAPEVVDDFSWEDSWFASIGAEWMMSDKFTARTGLGVEQTPVPNATRGARLPDTDRVWLSFGASYKWSDSTTFDLGYSHIFFDDSTIVRTLPTAALVGARVENSVDVLSLGMRMKW